MLALLTPMDYVVYEEFMDYELESDMMLERIGQQFGNFHLDIDEDDLSLRMSHLQIEEDEPMDIDDHPMD